MTKYCKDCKHCEEGRAHFWCNHPSFGTQLDSGTKYSYTCKSVRHNSSLCGEGANWFEQRPTLAKRFLQFFQPAPKV